MSVDPITARAEHIREFVGCSWESACIRAEREAATPAGLPPSVEIVNCNHGGFYSVYDWGRADGMFGHMLGQVQRVERGCWIARRHGHYTEIAPPTFGTQREAVAFLGDDDPTPLGGWEPTAADHGICR